MKSIKCDVLVVGGGPAGCSVARATAKNDLNTILIEEHPEIGFPVQCAEAIGEYLFADLPFIIPKKQLIWKIDGMYFWADNIAFKTEGRIWSAYSINRKNWDQWLASLAVREGAKIFTKTKFISFEFDREKKVKKVLAIQDGKKKIIFRPKYIIAADGVNSTVLECLGEKNNLQLGYVRSFEMKNLKLKYPNYDQLFFGDFAPGAYAYIFPISKTAANVGVGTLSKKDDLEDFYNKFLDVNIIKKQVSTAKIISEKSGEAPIRKFVDKLVYDNIILVGDSANQNIKPFIEGNIPGIICGNILGNFLSEVVRGKEVLETYEHVISEKFPYIKESQIYTDFVYSDHSIESNLFHLILLGLMSGIISPEKEAIEENIQKGYKNLRNHIINNGGFVEE